MNTEPCLVMLVSLWCACTAGITTFAHDPMAGHLRARDLRCEYLQDPIGIEQRAPHLSWIVEADRRTEYRSAYRILVASSPEQLSQHEGDLWDSGTVHSDETLFIKYRGRPLASRDRCFWKVMTWDRDGNPGPWSDVATWEMGLLTPSDWSASWIEAGANAIDVTIRSATYYSVDGAVRKDVTDVVQQIVTRGQPIVASNDSLGGDPARDVLKRLAIEYECNGTIWQTDIAENATATLANERLPYLRKPFVAAKPIERARLYVTALGLYETSINGKRIGDEYLAPGWTDYRKRVQYQVYDVTEHVRSGENMIGAIVAPGWFCGRAGLFNARQFYGETPALRAQLEMTYVDGSTERVITDETWQRHDGPYIAADIMDGVMYDARAELDDSCMPGATSEGWTAVTVRREARHLERQIDQPVRILDELPAITVDEPAPGRWTFDLGQNMVGVVRLSVDEAPGTVVTLRHGEMLNSDGTIYTQNLRSASATDVYICQGGGETWQPCFTFHGFRYVEVTGLTAEPGLDAVTGIVLGSDLPMIGEFECSDGRINQLQSNIVWGLRGNHVSIPTDCPQRDERMGWTGDAQAFVSTATYNADLAAFMSKWMIDMEDAQREDGAHSDVAPVMEGLNYGTPGWADAGTVVPWNLYSMCGDRRILEYHIDSMMRWVDWCHAHSTGFIRDRARGNDYGDWLSINADTPKELIGTAFFAHSTDIVAKSLRVLERHDEAQRYENLLADIRQAFIQKYVDQNGRVHGNTQTAYVLALSFDLLPKELRDEAVELLVADIESKNWHLSTGFIGVSRLLPVLHDAGRADVAYRLLLQDSFPSWLFPVKHSATTIWERWNGWTPETGPHPQWGMNSFNHYALGSCGEWLFAGVSGIRPHPDHPGFKHFIIAPAIDRSLTWASATYESPHGTIATRWEFDDNTLTLDLTIPANTSATIIMPDPPGSKRGELGTALEDGRGITYRARGTSEVEIHVPSGQYTLTTILPPDFGK